MKRVRLVAWVISAWLVVLVFLSCVLPVFFSRRIKSNSDNFEPVPAVLVLGARAISNETPGTVWKSRLDSAYLIYNAGLAQKILVSGDHGRKQYDEVNAGRVYLVSLGVPAEDIFLDHAGFDTYDSLYRAKNIFGLDRVIIVSNRFHLSRALMIADAIGLDAVAFVAPWPYRSNASAVVREIGARVKAFFDITFFARPKYLGEKIDISGSGLATWDTINGK